MLHEFQLRIPEFEGTDYSNKGKRNTCDLQVNFSSPPLSYSRPTSVATLDNYLVDLVHPQTNLEFVSAMSDALGKRQRKTGAGQTRSVFGWHAHLKCNDVVFGWHCTGCYNDSEYYKRALKGA